MAQLTTAEALGVLRAIAEKLEHARCEAARLEAQRDALIRALDGQPGMLRRDMAAAVGLQKQRFGQIVQLRAPEREQLADGVPMDQELYDALVDVVGGVGVDRHANAVRLQVHV